MNVKVRQTVNQKYFKRSHALTVTAMKQKLSQILFPLVHPKSNLF